MILTIDIINAIVVFALFLTALLIWIKSSDSSKWTSIFFIVCVISYVIIEYVPSAIPRYIIIAGPFLLPFAFWLVTKSLFSDHPLSTVKMLSFGILALAFYYGLYFAKNSFSGTWNQLTSLLSRTVSLMFVILAIVEAQRGRNADLVESRRKKRSTFTYVVSTLLILTLLAELGLSYEEQTLPRLLQRSAILLFNAYFIVVNVRWENAFFSAQSKKSVVTDPVLADKIQSLVINEKLYRKEGLTIGQLSEHLSEQEYKVRQTINQQLAYRNFTDYINSFRIQEAREILADLEQRDLTVLEIAYRTGFNSIGPFNRAFKRATGLTPTTFRDQALA